MYNVRIKKFYDTEQVQVFSKGVRSKGEVEYFDTCCDPITGEVIRHEVGELIENPFTGKVERMKEFYDIHRSEKVSKSRSIRAIYDIARSNCWEWFFTFTFSPERVDRYSFEDCTKKFSKWLNNQKKIAPDMMYIVVPELHKDGAYHFHGLFSKVDGLGLTDSGKLDSFGNPIYNIGKYKWGWTTATKIVDFRRASSYLCKYITKELCAVTKGKKRYWHSKNCRLPVIEEYLIEESEENRLIEMMKQGHTYIKKLETPFSDITYIERPLTADSGYTMIQPQSIR